MGDQRYMVNSQLNIKQTNICQIYQNHPICQIHQGNHIAQNHQNRQIHQKHQIHQIARINGFTGIIPTTPTRISGILWKFLWILGIRENSFPLFLLFAPLSSSGALLNLVSKHNTLKSRALDPQNSGRFITSESPVVLFVPKKLPDIQEKSRYPEISFFFF